MKPHLPILLCALLTYTFSDAQTPSKTPPPELPEKAIRSLPFEDARRMTMMVKIKLQKGSLGSAVWIGNTGYLATCFHVIKNVQLPIVVGMPHDPVFSSGKIDLVISGTVDTVDVTVAAFDESTDVAILKASHPPAQSQSPQVSGTIRVNEALWTSKGASLHTEPPKSGKLVLLAGYPLDQTTLILQTGIATGEGYFPTTQAAAGTPLANGRRIMLSLVSNPGNSGGPVFDNDGNVIGLLEGNLLSPMRDMSDKQILSCLRSKLDPSGNPLRDQAGNPVLESTPCVQNSGISISVPAQFIVDLAKKNSIDLR